MRDEQLIRDDLLGRISINDQAVLHRMRSEDRDFDEWCSIVETDLIDEYVQGELTSEDRDLFERAYLVTEERRKKVSFARLVLSSHAEGKKRPWWALAAVVAMVAIGFGAWFFVPREPATLSVALRPKIERSEEGIQIVRVPASAALVELKVVSGRQATLFLSGESQPLVTWSMSGALVRIPAADLDETEYLLVVSDEQIQKKYNFRVVRK
jgi:hypothetical protein